MWNPCLLLLSSFFPGLEHQGSSRVIHLQPGVLFAFKDSTHLNFTLFWSQSSLYVQMSSKLEKVIVAFPHISFIDVGALRDS